MTITPVASKSLESISAEPNADAPSGFDVLLAAADGSAPVAGNDTPSDGTTPAPPDKDPAPTTDGNIAGLLAVLAALGWTAPTPAAAPATAIPSADTPTPDAETAAPTTSSIAALIDFALAADANVAGQLTAPTPTTTASAPPATAPVDPSATTTLEASIESAIETIAAAAAPSGPPAPTTPARPSAIASDAAISITGAQPQPKPANTPAPTPSITTGSSATDATAKATPIAIDAASTPASATVSAGSTAATGAANAAAPIAVTVDHARPAAAHLDTTTTTTTLVGNGPAPAQAPTETAVVEQVTTTPTAAPPPPAEQLVHVLTPMRGSANGTYTLHIELKPAELGRVEMRVEMKDGVLHASIHSDHEGSAQLLRDALGDLRDRLEAANVHTGELTVTDGGVGARDQDGTNAQPQADLGAPADSASGNAPTTTAAPAGPNTFDPDTTSLLDVRV